METVSYRNLLLGRSTGYRVVGMQCQGVTLI